MDAFSRLSRSRSSCPPRPLAGGLGAVAGPSRLGQGSPGGRLERRGLGREPRIPAGASRAPEPPRRDEEPGQALHARASSRCAAHSTVEFPNVDPIYHNVFSVSPANRFDLGLYRSGGSKEKTFDEPGLVRVYCNIHPQMVGFVMVVDSDFAAVTGPDGAFRFDGVPPGSYVVHAWHEEGAEVGSPSRCARGATTPLAVRHRRLRPSAASRTRTSTARTIRRTRTTRTMSATEAPASPGLTARRETSASGAEASAARAAAFSLTLKIFAAAALLS